MLKFHARTDVGLRRKHNEDSLLAADEFGVFVVADGVGGRKAGELASAITVNTFQSYAPKIKQAVQAWYKRAFEEVVGPRYASSAPPPGVSPERYKRQHSAVEYLTEHFHEAPVWIVACIDEGTARPTRWSGASIYPAVQNMLLAARALGLGCTLTTRHLLYERESEAAMGLPEGVHSYAILPIGYPMGRFGPVGRGKLSDIVFQDKWGQPYQAMKN